LILIIESCLSEPPSEISCFRDVTLYAKTFLFEDVLLECKEGTRSIYWEWLKRHGAHDYISQLVKEEEREMGFTIKTQQANLVTDRINCNNLNEIVYRLNILR
jgi:hypothetical protein|tara:strand:- start:1579 stop:1887 length:309 start_codon:yes stop_codon:yes gene_type:complete